MAGTGLWPDLRVETRQRGMKQILEEVGGELMEMTNGLIQFGVDSTGDPGDQGLRFIHHCSLRVPRVGFKMLLLNVITGPTTFPAIVVAASGERQENIPDEESLRKVLATIFQSEATKETLHSLIVNFG